METTSSFGYWIRRQRKALDLTQQVLAERVGCSLAAIKKIESDERRPSRQIAERMADVLGVPEGQREIFLDVARSVRSVDQLVLAHGPASSALPTGIVTFLFTDIEESTKLAQEHPEEWETLRARHHVILRETIEAHNGYVFQVIGDAFCAAFDAPKDAFQAAIEAQRKLQRENWSEAPLKVRMAIHSGEAEAYRNEYRGYFTLSLAQRLVSAGHGGQTLLSESTENLLRGHLPKDISLLNLGEHKFKNILQPVRVFQVIAPDSQKEFPALRAQDVLLNNLPVQLTSFIGREKEIADVIGLLGKSRLVTLTGAGGTGKTRLSIQVAKELLDQYPDGVWMVELASILDPLLIPRTIAVAIGLRDEPHRPVIDMLCDYLREKKFLLLLDNCEHLIEACAQLADTLLHACQQIHILATSREALGMAGETLYLVPSLTLPDIRNLPPLESLDQYEAIKLFVDRATPAIPTFTLTNENASSIAQICQRLDGIPLAIELAAGKIRALSVGQIAQHLDDRFRLLRGGNRTSFPRHQTLQAAIDWSYNLLSPAEQILLKRLSVFVGGWTLEAAESVCPDSDTPNRDTLKGEAVLELLTQLVNKSLVMTEERIGEVRYHMLETIRQFGSDRLVEINESEALRDRHLEYFLQLAETAAPHLIRPEQVEWLARLEAEYENIRAALGWALGKESPEYALRFAAELGYFWYLHSYWLEGTKWLKSVLAKPTRDLTPVEKTACARALYWDANIAQEMNNVQRALASARASLTLCEAGTDRRDLAIARFQIGWAFFRLEEYELARRLLEQSLKEFRELQDVFWEAITQHWLSLVLLTIGEKSPSETFVQYLELARRIGERLILAIALSDLANWEWRNQLFDKAEAHLREYTMVCDQLGFKGQWFPITHGLIAHCRNDFQQAQHMYTKCKEQLDLMGDSRKSIALQYLGILERDQGNFNKAQYYMQEALKIAKEDRFRSMIGFRLALLGNINLLQGDLEGSRSNFKEGLPIVKEAKGRYSKSNPLLIFSNTYARLQPQVAVRVLSAVHAYYKNNINEPIDPLMIKESDRTSAQAYQHLNESSFNEAWDEGEKITLNEAIELALKTLDEM